MDPIITSLMFHNDGKKSATLDSRKFSFRKLKKDTIDPSEKSTSSEKSGQSSKLTVKKIFRKSSFKKLISHITRITSSQLNNTQKADRVPPLNNYVWPADSIPGVIGIRNHGNTCFMNATLQCLSHTDILAEYFVLDQYKVDLRKRNKLNSKKFGTKGELTEQLALVLKALWTCQDGPDYSTSFKAVVDRYGSQFRSSTQHDAQEFLFWMLDKVHEDLNTANKKKYKTIKNNYGRPDDVIAAETLANYVRCNNSFVQAVFQAQFRSSLTCPRCHKQSNTFDPFHCVSVQLPQLTQQPIIVKVLHQTKQPKQVQMGLGIPHGSSIVALREQLEQDTTIDAKRMIITEINLAGFGRIFCDSHAMSSVTPGDEESQIYCIETPKQVDDSAQIVLCILNVKKVEDKLEKFGSPFCLKVSRDVSFNSLQKLLLKEMSMILKSEIFAYKTPLDDLFKIHLQDPSADPDTLISPNVEHPLFTEMIDLALSVQPTDSGPAHVKLLLEWLEPEKYFTDLKDHVVEHESVSRVQEKNSVSSNLTLEQCLDHYTKAETLSAEDAWRCPHCQQYLPVVKTIGLWSTPDILVIHFKRFRQQQLKGPQASKLTTMVTFPLNGFDMSPHLAKPATSTTGSPKKKAAKRSSQLIAEESNLYDLYAVCYHQGETLETGHYTAACKNPYDQQWYKFDDQRVSKVECVPEEIVNNEAYMLFYQRRKPDNSECSATSSSSNEHWVSKITAATTIKVTSPVSEPPKEISAIKTEDEPEKEKVEEKPPTEDPITSPAAKEPPLLPSAPISDIISEIEAIQEMIDESIEEEHEPIHSPSNKFPEKAMNPVKLSLSPIKQVEDVILVTPKKEIVVVQMENENELVEIAALKEIPLAEDEFLQEMKEVKELLNESHKIEELMSQRAINNLLWNDTNIKPIKHHHHDVNKIKMSDLMGMDPIDLTSPASASLPKNYLLKDCDARSIIRGGTCKDTLLFIDQPGHSLEDDLLENRALWISPVKISPHKFELITVSPKN